MGARTSIGAPASLATIAPTLRRQRSLAGLIVRRFTWLAVASVLAIVISGTLQAALEVGSIDGLLTTPYGQGVLIKVALLLAMLVVAAVVRKRGAFERGVRVELALGVIVLAVAAVVAGTTPARQITQPPTTAAQAAR